jgi:hypothetical protein
MPAVSELEELLPDYIGADYVDKRAITGAELLDQGDPPIFDGMLAAVGAGPEAVEGALGTSTNVGVVILRVTGVSGADLGNALTDAIIAALPGTTITNHGVGGERLRRVAVPAPFDDQNLTILVVDDLLILGSGTPEHDALVDITLTTLFEPGLEVLLPATLDGRPLQRFSVPGIAFPEGGDICSIVCPGEPQRMAEEVGVAIEGVEIAVAGTDDEPAVSIVAMRFEGADTDALVPAREVVAGHGRLVEKTEHTVAGRTAWRYRAPPFDDTASEEWLYAKNDVLYVIRALPDGGDVPRMVELAIAALP